MRGIRSGERLLLLGRAPNHPELVAARREHRGHGHREARGAGGEELHPRGGGRGGRRLEERRLLALQEAEAGPANRPGAGRPLRRVHARRAQPVIVVAQQAPRAVEALLELAKARDRPVALLLNHQRVDAALEAEPAALAPVRAPGVADDPVLDAAAGDAPAGDRHVVVDVVGRVLRPVNVDALMLARILAVVVEEGAVGDDAANDGPTGEDLLHHGLLARHRAVLGHAEPGEGRHSPAALLLVGRAVAAHPREVAHAVARLVRLARLVAHRAVGEV
mmetsp:Transcript_27275/g.81375  ORF Transcript_27275/g.81375 Transcript_27275/m.81375 type:complete len:277 (+) Transcript_27275:188-1018(+)